MDGSLRNLLAVLAIGLIILALGCFNFINLVTVQAAQRIKEVGVRKTLGSSRRQLVLQHYVESLLLAVAAAVLAFAGAEMLRPALPEFAQSGPVIDLLGTPDGRARHAPVRVERPADRRRNP